MATGASRRATATTSAMDKEWPSSVIGVGMRQKDSEGRGVRSASLIPRPCAPPGVWASRRLSRCYCPPTRRRPLRGGQLRIPRIRLYTPVENDILAADRGDSQRGVVIRAGLVALEDVAVPGHRLVHVAGIAARGREVDRRQVGDG